MFLLPIGTRTYLLDPKNYLHRSVALSAFLVSLLGFVEYEIIDTTDEGTIAWLALIHSTIAMSVIYLAAFAAYFFAAPISKFWKKTGLIIILTLIIPPLFIVYNIFFNGAILDNNHELIDGVWYYEMNNNGTTVLIFGAWFIVMEFYLSISHLIAYMNATYKAEKRWKLLLFLTFTFIPFYVIYEYIFSVNSDRLGDYSMTPYLAIIIIIIGWIYTNFKLFEISPVAVLDNILDSMSNIVLICDNEFKVKYVNEASEKLSIKRKFLINKSLRDIANHFGSVDDAVFDLVQKMEKGERRENTFSYKTNDVSKHFLFTVSPSYNQQNMKIGYVYVFTDITENTETSNQLKEYTRQLEQSNKELERFAYIASHDMKTPLRNIVSFLNLIERRIKKQDDKELLEFINFATSNAKYMHSLVRDILEFSKISKLDETYESVDLNEIISQVETNLSDYVEKKNAIINVNLNGLTLINANKIHIGQLFQNLIENGIKYNENPKPEINIDTIINKKSVEIIIKDNGIGISKNFHEQIFEMFKRLHNSTQYQGTGIGLAICKKIVEMYGGEIRIESEEDKGTCFIITFPSKVLNATPMIKN
jgi:PAS domain S-box-containing protein